MLSAPLVHGAYRGGPSHHPGFSLVCDFKRGLYRRGAGRGRMVTDFLQLPGASYVRSGADLIVQTPAGLRRFAANVPPIVPGYGMECPEGTTNVCTNHNFAGASLDGLSASVPGSSALPLVSRVARGDLPGPVLAALNSEDPLGYVTHVTRVQSDAMAASQGCVCLGDIGVLTPSTASIFAYVVTGAGSVVLDANLSSLGQTALLSGFKRTELTITPDSTGRRLRTRNLSGVNPAEWYFFGNQFEPKAQATPVVPVAGAQASRGDPLAQVVGLDATFMRPFTLVGMGKGRPANGLSRVLAQVDNGTNAGVERLSISRTSTDVLSLVNGGGQNLNSVAGFAGALDVRAAGQYREDGLDLAVNGVSSEPRATTTLAARNRLTIGSSAAGTTVWYGPAEFVGLISRPTTQAEREALSA